MQQYNDTNLLCSKLITNTYSTSFSLGIKALHKKFQFPVYAVYGFVRYADEIVDTFHQYPKAALLDEFKAEAYKAIERGISLNPVLHSFQLVVNEYKIGADLIDAFLDSMAEDLKEHRHTSTSYQTYIYGSAEVVGLMCLKIFCEGDVRQYEILKPFAQKLGAAFQKVNFLRDIKSDYIERGRIYFPELAFSSFSKESKAEIERDIENDFIIAFEGIKQLPVGSKFGVYLAYIYYKTLFAKIKALPVQKIAHCRIRIPNEQKIILLIQSWLKYKFI